MITITIRGPVGSGKATIANRLSRMLGELGKSSLHLHDANPTAIERNPPDVLIIQEVG